MAKDSELPAGFEDLRGRKFQGRYALDELVHASPWRVTFAGRAHVPEQGPERGIVVELVRPSRLHDQATLERLERRVAACKRVRHPVVQAPIEAGELADGKLWLVVERPVGEPLHRHLQRQPLLGRLDWIDARPLLLELVRGLGAAHARHVIHGALNPSCCWVDRPDFGVPSLRVLGFGANTSPSAGDTHLAQSRTTALAYDAVFMAPETAGGVFGDERSDVYLAGLVAWVMLVGRPPFQAANPFQNAAMHLTAPLPAMRDAGVDVPSSVEELLRSMLAKKPAQRISGMGEIEQVLLGLDEGGEARDVREPPEPEGARGRRGRARARQAGVASREASKHAAPPEPPPPLRSMQLPSTFAPPHPQRVPPPIPPRPPSSPQPLDRFAPAAAVSPPTDHTEMLTSHEVANLLWSGQGQAPPVVPVVTGGTERITPEQVRMFRLAALGPGDPPSSSAGRTPEPGVEATQMLEIERDRDLEEEQTNTLSPEQVRALRRALGKHPEEE